MRSIFIFLMFANCAVAQQRTWTITTAVVTAEAELVGVRGDVVHLKIGDKIESVPLARLSAADHEFLASVDLAPVRSSWRISGPELIPSAGQGTGIPPVTIGAAGVEEDIPAPSLISTPATAGLGTTPSMSNANNPPRRANNRGSVTAAAGNTNGATPQRRGASTTTARRLVSPSSNQSQSATRGNSNSSEPPGILGLRDRRGSRQRDR